jgi:hypothetical protein
VVDKEVLDKEVLDDGSTFSATRGFGVDAVLLADVLPGLEADF